MPSTIRLNSVPVASCGTSMTYDPHMRPSTACSPQSASGNPQSTGPNMSRLASILVPSGTLCPTNDIQKPSPYLGSGGGPLGTFSPITSPLALLPVLIDSGYVDHASPVLSTSDGHQPGSTGPGGPSSGENDSVHRRDNCTNRGSSSHPAPPGGGSVGGVNYCSSLVQSETNGHNTVVLTTHSNALILSATPADSLSQGEPFVTT
ncbi:unnamed protein product [Echinostoma caproni]|uniref:Homeobox protein araucan n=1 Tax=Echinostoma caproni TaxID=27848 RepID=A0A183B0S4_9TREM|nr:unnamed protein product [Echinostoma caproni]